MRRTGYMICGFMIALAGCGQQSAVVPPPSFSPDAFPHRELIGEKRTIRYRVFVPARVPDQNLPVILYLHGADDRGNDNELQLRGLIEHIQSRGAAFPFMVVFPQCPKNRFWDKELIRDAVAALDQTTKELNGDENRLYVAGFSLGGYGAWSAAAMYPNKFAAVVPMSGRVLPRPAERAGVADEIIEIADADDPYSALAARLGKTAVWIFHGADDNIVPVANSRKMADALKNAGNEKTKYTEFPGTGHYSLDLAMNDPELLEWLSQQYISR